MGCCLNELRPLPPRAAARMHLTRRTLPAPVPTTPTHRVPPPAPQEPYGTLFVSIPSLLDPSLCPEGTHTFHAFT